MVADLAQKEAAAKLAIRQHLWETPKGLAAIIAALAVTIGALGGIAGYALRGVPQPPAQIIFQPGSIVVPPAPAK